MALSPRPPFVRSLCLAAGLAAGLLPASCGDSDQSTPTTSDAAPEGDVGVVATGRSPCPDAGEEWEVAKLYIEHNATDEDTGIHGLIGGVAWRELCVFDPDGNQIWLVDPRAQLHDLAVSDFLFESREPEASEYSIDDLRRDFPEGTYLVAGTDHEGVARVGEARFTHAIPEEPEITAPTLADDVETAGDAVIGGGDLTVAWEPVTQTVDGGPLTVSGYQVIVTMEEFEDPDGLSRPVYDVHVASDLTALTVPAEFFMPDTAYELEVLALEQSGNQTISVGFFRTP